MKKEYISPDCDVLGILTVAMIADSSSQGGDPVTPTADTPTSPKTTNGQASSSYAILAKGATFEWMD